MNKIIYNVTVSVDETVHEEWLSWMKGIHVPEVLATGFFENGRICRVLAHEEGGVTYAVQYVVKSMSDYERYQADFAPALQAKHIERYGQQVAAFRTILEILHEES
jgi:Domain of unknown function (DUF4286)